MRNKYLVLQTNTPHYQISSTHLYLIIKMKSKYIEAWNFMEVYILYTTTYVCRELWLYYSWSYCQRWGKCELLPRPTLFTSLKAWTRVWRYFSKDMATSLVRMTWILYFMPIQYIIFITQKLDATTRNRFQILILHPKKNMINTLTMIVWSVIYANRWYVAITIQIKR